MGHDAALCMPVRADDQVAYGDHFIVSESAKGPVTIDSVDIPGASGVETYVTTRLVGSMALSNPIDSWDEREPAEGYEVEPGETAYLAAVFPPEFEGLEKTSMVVNYHTHKGREHAVKSDFWVTVEAEACF